MIRYEVKIVNLGIEFQYRLLYWLKSCCFALRGVGIKKQTFSAAGVIRSRLLFRFMNFRRFGSLNPSSQYQEHESEEEVCLRVLVRVFSIRRPLLEGRVEGRGRGRLSWLILTQALESGHHLVKESMTSLPCCRPRAAVLMAPSMTSRPNQYYSFARPSNLLFLSNNNTNRSDNNDGDMNLRSQQMDDQRLSFLKAFPFLSSHPGVVPDYHKTGKQFLENLVLSLRRVHWKARKLSLSLPFTFPAYDDLQRNISKVKFNIKNSKSLWLCKTLERDLHCSTNF